MYALAAQLQRFQEIAEDGEALLAKKLYILQNTHLTVSEPQIKGLRDDINKVRDDLEKQQYDAAC